MPSHVSQSEEAWSLRNQQTTPSELYCKGVHTLPADAVAELNRTTFKKLEITAPREVIRDTRKLLWRRIRTGVAGHEAVSGVGVSDRSEQ